MNFLFIFYETLNQPLKNPYLPLQAVSSSCHGGNNWSESNKRTVLENTETSVEVQRKKLVRVERENRGNTRCVRKERWM